MIEKLFPGKTKREILRLLLFSKDEFHLREIARKIKITPIYVSKELNNFEKIGLVKKQKKANLHFYSINKNHKLYKNLREIFVKSRSILDLLKSKLKNLDINYAFVFGSYAEGKDTEKSDIDLFIIGKLDENKLLEKIQIFEKEIGKEVNYIIWSKSLFLSRAKKHHLLKQIAKKPIIVLKGNENELKKIIR